MSEGISRPPRGFGEAWHAQVLAIADSLIRADAFSARDWAETLGAALKAAEAAGAEDTPETYYDAALQALETLTTRSTDLSESDLAARKADWTRAYLATPHGAPVELDAGAE